MSAIARSLLLGGWVVASTLPSVSMTRADEIILSVAKGPGPAELTLQWIGGVAPFDVHRSASPADVADPGNVVGSTDGNAWIDPDPAGNRLFYTVVGTCVPIPDCPLTLTYHGSGTSVSLRGDFAPDGWTVGVPMTPTADGFEATIAVLDQQVVLYKFVVDGTWIADPDNPRRSPDGYGAYNSVVRADCDQCPGRAPIDWRDVVLYSVLVDRFANGTSANDAPVPGAEPPANYAGGDFAGLQAKIEEGYFDGLGVNAIWITWPADNTDRAESGPDGHMHAGYHGSWPKNLEQVESRFGTDVELRSLAANAHARGIQLLIDYVGNHVHTDSPVYSQHPEWFWPNDNGHGGNCICGQGCDWEADRLRCWFASYLPSFNFGVNDARRFSVGNAISWAQRNGLDGLRLDTIRYIETPWLTDLRARADPELAWDQAFHLSGQTFTGNREVIRSYVDPDVMLDGQSDFPLRAAAAAHILRRDGSMLDLADFLAGNDGYYGERSVMWTFLGNQDFPRAIHLAEDVPLFDVWDTGGSRAWSNQPTLPTSRSAFERVAVAYTLLFSLPGIPTLYYGDEIGMPGAGNPDNRRLMAWIGYTSNQLWLRDRISGLARARREHPALRRGAREPLDTSWNVLSYRMTAPGDTVYVVLNRGDDAATVNLPAGSYLDAVTGAPVSMPGTVPARTGLLLVEEASAFGEALENEP